MGSSGFSLVHLTRPSSLPGPAPLLVLLHGLGSNESDLFSLAPLVDQRFVVVSARAPHLLGPNAYAWFAIEFSTDGLQIDVQQGRRSRGTVVGFVEEICDALPIDRSKVFIMGFSQGAMLAAAVTLARPDLPAGTVLMSGAVAPELAEPMAPTEALQGFPMAQTHGTWDPVLPVELGRQGRTYLTSLAVDLDYAEFDMGHEVTSESIAWIRSWLSARLELS